MRQFHVTGMSCASCSARVEKAVSSVEGVKSCSVNLLTNSMGVEGTASDREIIAAVQNAGYGASVKGETAPEREDEQSLSNGSEIKTLRNRLVISLCVLLPLLYLSMGKMMLGAPLPPFLNAMETCGLAQLLLSGALLVINQRFFVSGVKGLLHKAPNMDTLVALGASAAFGYSVWELFALLHTPGKDVDFYFESAGMIVTLITLGKLLESRSKGKTTDALKQLMRLTPKTATVLAEDGSERTVPIGELHVGETFVLRSGERVPTDGVLTEGSISVDESALTGESVPVDKVPGDTLSAATVCRSGYAVCQATRVGEDTTLSQIIRMVSDAAATKAPIAKLADKVSGIFVPAVSGIAAVTLSVWLAVGKDVGFALARAISVLVISCPCALGLATPVAIMVGSGKGAKNGILFKTAASLEAAGRIEIVAMDKTGTLTNGTPVVTDVLPEETDEAELLSLAYALEQKSEHPLASAVVEYAKANGVLLNGSTDFAVYPGCGVSAVIDGVLCVSGNLSFVSGYTSLSELAKAEAEVLSEEGKTPLFFVKGGVFVGIIAVADVLKPDAKQTVTELKNMGIRVVLLTGDNEKTASRIGAEAGIDEIRASLLPGDKEQCLRTIRAEGKTAMVGDGINDAPALTAADLGIAIGAGTDVAVDAADVVLVGNNLSSLAATVRLGRSVLRNIKQNLFWAFFYNAVGIPLAAGVWIPLFGLALRPAFGAAAMSLSSFCVVGNALRLNFGSVYDAKRDKKRRSKRKKASKTGVETQTLRIEGMMCAHCEEHIRSSLSSLPGVSVLSVSHLQGQAVIRNEKNIPRHELQKAISEAGYTLL